MKRCVNCKREIGPFESHWRDFDGKLACNDCYTPTFKLVLPDHGKDHKK